MRIIHLNWFKVNSCVFLAAMIICLSVDSRTWMEDAEEVYLQRKVSGMSMYLYVLP